MELPVTETLWKIKLRIYRSARSDPPKLTEYLVEASPDEYVLDAVEKVWAIHDRSLTFRHACHHGTCGTCGMRVNGIERLTCITLLRDVTHDGGTLLVEPLQNFPIVSDLVVDMSTFYQRIEMAGMSQVVKLKDSYLRDEIKQIPAQWVEQNRLADCIECGLCISACPAAHTSNTYLGPAVLAAIQQSCMEGNTGQCELADHEGGVWRCHSAFECTEVCPSHVNPAARIMDLRSIILRETITKPFLKLFQGHK
jgi:succinate dehydrogenase / fumarate reductase iron-sulfur subunit